MKSVTSCSTCSGRDAERLFTKRGHAVVRCSNCGLVYLDHAPSESSLKDFYSEGYYFNGGYQNYIDERPFIRLNARRRIKEIKKIKPSGRLLEIGCALGFFIEEARKSFDVYGIELSEYGSTYARDKLDLNVKTGTLQVGSYPKGYFDVVVMWDVIEHLTDPRGVLIAAKGCMSPDGLLVFTTMDAGSFYARLLRAKWHLYDIPEHLTYYDKKTVAEALGRAGFAVRAIRNDGNLYSIGYVFFRLSVMYKSFLWRPLKKIFDALKISDIIIPVNLGDLMTVYAVPK